jgi:hypothetical protein
MSEKLGCHEVWWLGVFIAPTIKMVVGRGCYRWAHWTVRCVTGHCLVRQPHHPTVRVWPLELCLQVAPDSLVPHRTGTVHCLVRLPALLCVYARWHTLFTVHFADDRWCSSSCSAWHTGQSGATPDSRWIIAEWHFQKPEAEEFGVILPGHRTLSGGTPDSPVCQTRAAFSFQCSFLLNPFF